MRNQQAPHIERILSEPDEYRDIYTERPPKHDLQLVAALWAVVMLFVLANVIANRCFPSSPVPVVAATDGL